MKSVLPLAGLVLASAATPLSAGPPYLTDDPDPTKTGHWEIYGFTAGEGRRSTIDADAGLDLNYGPVKDVQLTATLPLTFSHTPADDWRSATGDIELGVKYRFLHDEHAGFSASVFPRVILPTSGLASGERARFLLPLWVGKDFDGGTSVFGGAGYMINRGAGNRNFWQAAVAMTHDLSKQISVGAEVTRQGSDSAGGTIQTRAGLGSIIRLSDRYAVLVSAGPTWANHQTGYHFYAALGVNL